MKTTVGIVTMYRNNYGAFLQAYSLLTMLKELGYSPEIIRYDYDRDRTILGIPLLKAKRPVKFVKRLAVELIRYRSHRMRDKVFAKSINKYIDESKVYYRTYKELENTPPPYDVYLSGSDQVFNVSLSPQALKARLLCFVKEGIRISFAASSGEKTLSPMRLTEFEKALPLFQSLSVREEGLANWIRQNMGLQVFHHLDPTLLLSKEKWERFAQISCDIEPNSYIFYYRVARQPDVQMRAEQLSKELNLPVYVADGNDNFSNMLPRDGFISPETWVGMLSNAAYVVTNSFHGTAFSIRLNKKVSVVLPPTGQERIRDIISKCNLKRLTDTRVLDNEEMIKLYECAYEYLLREQERAIIYLRGAMPKNE